MVRRPVRGLVTALVLGAMAFPVLGMSLTLYHCPMWPEPSARPCCPDVSGEPAPEGTISQTPCCLATSVAIAPAPSDRRQVQPEVRLQPAVSVIAPALVLVTPHVRAIVPRRIADTHGPPPLERTTRLLI